MSYDELVKKYEGKKQTLFVVLIIIEIVSIFLLLGLGLFISYLCKTGGTPESYMKIGRLTFIPSFLILIAAFTLPEVILMKRKKHMREYFRRIQEQTGLASDDVFAETLSISKELPHVKNVFYDGTYIIDLASYWGCRLDHITDIRIGQEVTTHAGEADTVWYYVGITHDGKESRLYVSQLHYKKTYEFLYNEWQRVTAAR